ncbi:MAG: hypothetical protein L0312_22765, partial [Acidobacteria bacterium]|nr:hypothetical protein [Acidobacteriota bacterium]
MSGLLDEMIKNPETTSPAIVSHTIVSDSLQPGEDSAAQLEETASADTPADVEAEPVEEVPAIFKAAYVKSMDELREKLNRPNYESAWRREAEDLRHRALAANQQAEHWKGILANKQAEAQGYEHSLAHPMQRAVLPPEQLAIKLAAKEASKQQVEDCQAVVEMYRAQAAEYSRKSAQ